MHIIPFLPKQWGIYHLFFCTKKTVEKSLQSRTMWSCYSSLKPYNFALIACQRVNVFWLRDSNFDVALLLPTYTHKECFIVQHCRLLQKKKKFLENLNNNLIWLRKRNDPTNVYWKVKKMFLQYLISIPYISGTNSSN